MNGTSNRRPTSGDHLPGDVAVQERPAGPATPVDLEEFEKFFREQFSTPVAPGAAPVAAAKPGVEDPLMAELARIVGQEVRPSIAAASPPPMPKATDPFVTAAPSNAPDPLRAFEEELRRFDAEREAARLAAAPPAPPMPDLRGAQPAVVSDPRRVELEQALQPPLEAQPRTDLPGDSLAVEPPPLEDLAEAQPRSKKVMVMLGLAGAIALTGVIGTLGFAGRSKPTGGEAPVIAAKPGPTKEKPADPGGVEISGQDRQVLARGQNEPKAPAAVVNKEEQPVDLNQTPKREAARVVLPPTSGQTNAPILMPSGSQQPSAPASEGQQASAAGGVEPKRVRSVRVSGDGETAPAATAARPAQPASAPTAQRPPSLAAAPPPTAATPPAAVPPKTEARPTTAVRTIPATPGTTPQPARPATPPRPAPAAAAPAAESEDGEGPISLRPPSGARNAATPARTASTSGSGSASGGSGGFAVQLKASPSESDARSAAASFKQRHADALGGHTPGVRQATVDGKTVYRVRVGGLSRDAATGLCNRIKADGGSCFVAGN